MDPQLDDYVFKVLKDFEDIFMAEGVKKILGADYDNFIGNIAFLKGWPVYKLSENPSSCMFHYYNPGHVLVKDSNDSDWIYIVKSGSISVMKKLTQVAPRKSPAYERQRRLAKQGLNVTVPFKERKRRKKVLSPLNLPDVPRPEFQSQFEMKMKMDQTIPGLYKENDRLGILDYDTILHDYKSRLRISRVPEVTSSNLTSTDVSGDFTSDVDDRLDDNEGPLVLPEITKSTRGVYMSAKRGRTRSNSTTSKHYVEGLTEDDLDVGDKRKDDISTTRFPEVVPALQRSSSPVSSVDNTLSPPDAKPIFILVQVLEKGQYFGVGGVVFRESQPSLSVVSNGAECLLLSKQFFKQHATESIINHLRKTEVPYPSESELQQKLQEYTDWRSYRALSYRQLVQPLITGRARRGQYTTNYRGQYNYRTGPT